MTELELTSWRRAVATLYAEVRGESDPALAHAGWRAGRDELFRGHPQSPLTSDDPLRRTGLPYWPYDPALRFTVPVDAAPPLEREVPSANDGTIRFRRVGQVHLSDPLVLDLDVWWLAQYGGGLFIPLRDGTAGHSTYGGGRYLLDTAKGADLGGSFTELVLDLNFAYHPSCRYNPRWECPLAPEGNTTPVQVEVGERL